MRITLSIDAIIEEIESALSDRIDSMTDEVIRQVQSLLDRGVGRDAVISKLVAEADSLSGIFSGWGMAGTVTSQINMAQQVAYLEAMLSVYGEDGDFVWVLDPAANHCSTCPTKDGMVMTMEDWFVQGFPGSGVDECGQNCRCTLIPIEEEQ